MVILIVINLQHITQKLSNPTTTLLLSGFVLILGSVLPDVDHPFSKIRKSFRYVLFIFVFLSFIFLLNQGILETKNSNGTNSDSNSINSALFALFRLLISVIGSFIIVFLIDSLIPGHRGIIHGFSFAFIFGILSFSLSIFISLVLLGMNIQSIESKISTFDHLMVGFCGFCGYISHIISDILGFK